LKPSRLKFALEKLLEQKWAAFVWGAPGIGKSSIVKHLAESKDLPVIDIRASLLDPTDLRGIPMIDQGRAKWCPPTFLPDASQKPGILFLDEINAAPPLVQASLYQLVLDRRIGEYALPPGWWIVAAGNRQKDRAVTFRMSSALSNRFVHLNLDVDVDDWRTWAMANKLNTLVTAFIALRPRLLQQEPGEAPAFATPRTWEMVSDMLNTFGGPDKCSDVLPGVIGAGPSVEFLAFAKNQKILKRVEQIVESPGDAELPTNLDELYLLTTWLAQNASTPTVTNACAVLMFRLPAEFSVILVKDVVSAYPAFVKNPEYRRFLKENASLISG